MFYHLAALEKKKKFISYSPGVEEEEGQGANK